MAMQKTHTQAPLASAARTTSGNSTAFACDNFDEALVMINVSAASGTSPTLDITFEVYDGANWMTHTAATQITGAGSQVMKLTNLGTEYRIKYTIGGTSPSFTFSVVVKGKSLG